MLSSLLDFCLPRTCLMCSSRLSKGEKLICLSCSISLPRTNFHLQEHNTVEKLFWNSLQPVRATSLLFYNSEGMHNTLHRLKYFEEPEIGAYLAEMLATEIADSGFFEGIDAIIPVPLAKRRLHYRGYNQSEMIARGISRATGISIIKDAVIRKINNVSQTQVLKSQRSENVRGIFSVKHPELLTGKHCLLVDDVLTTGATLSSLAQEVTKARDTRVSILTLSFATNKSVPATEQERPVPKEYSRPF